MIFCIDNRALNWCVRSTVAKFLWSSMKKLLCMGEWILRCLKSLTTRLFVQYIAHTNNNEIIKAADNLCRESTGDCWIPGTRGEKCFYVMTSSWNNWGSVWLSEFTVQFLWSKRGPYVIFVPLSLYIYIYIWYTFIQLPVQLGCALGFEPDPVVFAKQLIWWKVNINVRPVRHVFALW